ncbi:MAG: signal recognition particle subunit SRP19/SEC65 family protein [Thermoplasmata archaeon]|jgi:signal recognition particle subunit SRP19|nr:signal recognition particle subunit SRP19/SEC65 family protein [Thermoplasmata archaeon]
MPDHFYVYPTYLGRERSRKDGRRVPADLALADLTGEEIVDAAQHLGFKAELESGKQYPRSASAYEGRVKVVKKGSATKAKFLRSVALELARRRAAGGKK